MPIRDARYVTTVARRPKRPRRYMANAPTASTITNAMLRGFVELPTIHTPAVMRSARTTDGGTSLRASAGPRLRWSHHTALEVAATNTNAAAATGRIP